MTSGERKTAIHSRVDPGAVSAYRYAAVKAVLAERERELLELRGPCSTCRLHHAHAGPCAPTEPTGDAA